MRWGGAIIILGLILATAVHAQSSHEPNPIVLPQGPHMENPADSSHVYVRPNDPGASHLSWSSPLAGTTPEDVFLLGVILLGISVIHSLLRLFF